MGKPPALESKLRLAAWLCGFSVLADVLDLAHHRATHCEELLTSMNKRVSLLDSLYDSAPRCVYGILCRDLLPESRYSLGRC